MLPYNSNKTIKKVSLLKVSAKKKALTKVSGSFLNKKIAAKKNNKSTW